MVLSHPSDDEEEGRLGLLTFDSTWDGKCGFACGQKRLVV